MPLQDTPFTVSRGAYTVTTDRRHIDLDATLALLHTTEWAATMPRDVFVRAVENSVTFVVLHQGTVVGVGRAVTDLATYVYWTDIVIAAPHRRAGLGQWLVQCMLAHPELQGLRRVALLTKDARTLYERAGFSVDTGVSTYMEMRPGPNASTTGEER